MYSRKFKYQEYLSLFSNCPPNNYKEIPQNSYRWIFKDNTALSFIPLNLIKEPPQRMLDNTDLMCKGYGLSLFNTLEKGKQRYKDLYKKKRGLSHEDFLKEKGDCIAELQLDFPDGVHGDLNTGNGHFTFHEYEGTDLSLKIVNIVEMFNENGNFEE